MCLLRMKNKKPLRNSLSVKRSKKDGAKDVQNLKAKLKNLRKKVLTSIVQIDLVLGTASLIDL